MKEFSLDENDKKLLEEARGLILEVYEYHRENSCLKNELNRIETILNKLDYLLKL